jgi:HAE1 family hydrophobic/amphiphilic exporter-1
VVAYIGLIMLAGIVVNQSIVLIDAVNQGRERGLPKHDAILEAGRLRLRPIIITKLTTILGLLPMALGLGEGAEIRQPMAVTVIGGVAIASFFTLLVIPVVYSLLDRKHFPAAVAGASSRPALEHGGG